MNKLYNNHEVVFYDSLKVFYVRHKNSPVGRFCNTFNQVITYLKKQKGA